MKFLGNASAPLLGRRSLLGISAALLALPRAAKSAQPRRYQVGFANIAEDQGLRLEGLGFTPADIRASFILAARALPVDLVFFDNDRNREKTLANAAEAIARRLDLYIQYCDDLEANAEIAKRLRAAGIPILALIHPVPAAPLYGPDNTLAGRLAGGALAAYAVAHWHGQPMVAAIVGDLAEKANHVPDRVDAIAAALKEQLPVAAQTRLDSGGNPAQTEAQLRRFAAAQSSSKLLVAALDDTTALLAKSAIEDAGRSVDTAIVSQGCDRSVHGGVGDKKEIDPNNRGSILIGSVAYLLDRYGYEVMPIVMKMLAGEGVPPHIATRHVLVTAANVFTVYPPIDMN